MIYEAILLLFLAKFVLTDFRIFVLNEQGITAKLFCFKKRYSWSELKIKRVMSVESKIIGRNSPYKKGVMFSKRAKITALEFIDPNEYSFITLNPFKYIYFNFKPQRGGYGMYEVDEELFFKKMLEWGVELQIDSEFKFIS